MGARQNVQSNDEKKEIVQDTVSFNVEVFESRFWKNKYLEALAPKEIKEKNEDQILVVKITRVLGDPLVFNKLKNNFLLTFCSSIIKGLPGWALKMEQKLQEEEAKSQKAEPEQVKSDDDYSKELDKTGNGFNNVLQN